MNYRGYLEYEIVHKPFFGSRKRAKELLQKAENNNPLDVEGFIAYLQKTYSKLFPMIEFIRFYDYVFQSYSDSFHFRTAMIFTTPNERIRNTLYDDGKAITLITGWYPYVTGRRANIKKLDYMKLREQLGVRRPRVDTLGFGKPLEVINISSTPTASATMLRCDTGFILFDTGFGIKEKYIDCIDLICISHFHNDHIGGLVNILKVREIPFLASEITLEYIIKSITN